MNTINVTLSQTNARLYSIYLGKAQMKGIVPGLVTVTVRSHPEMLAQGTISPYGHLSGMSRIYTLLALKAGDTLVAEVVRSGTIQITDVRRGGDAGATDNDSRDISPEPCADQPVVVSESVFIRRRLRPIHIELFSPENLNRWEPETEADVYMGFGVLQEYTRFRYCCGASKALLDRLGFQANTKPDAILVRDDTGEYAMTEFKMKSSAFSFNHQPQDVDVLIVWDHDEPDLTKLPPEVISLREIARAAAQELIRG